MKRVFIYILFLLLPLVASSQALPFAAADFSAAALAKAGTSAVETSSTAFSAFGNVAAVPYSGFQGDFAAGYSLWQPSSAKTNVLVLGGSYNIRQKIGVALGVTYGMHPGYEIFTDQGTSKGTFSPSDMQIKAGFAWRFLPFLSAGVNLGYASSSLAEGVSYGAFMADVFLMSKFSDIKVALGVSDLGTAVTSASGVRFPLPSAITLGAGYEKVFAQVHGIDVSAEADYYFAGAFAASFGAEYIYDEMVSVRAGYRYGGTSVLPSYASAGIGSRFFGAAIDLAYVIPVGHSPMSNTLSVTLGYSF